MREWVDDWSGGFGGDEMGAVLSSWGWFLGLFFLFVVARGSSAPPAIRMTLSKVMK